MKTKYGLSSLIMLTILVLMLGVTVLCKTNKVDTTYSYLTDEQSIIFNANVSSIDIKLKQGARELTSSNNQIYIGSNVIEGDKTYTLNVTLTNNEQADSYFARFKVVANVNGVLYNINDYITTDFFKNVDGWAYNTENASSSTPLQLAANQTKTVINTLTIPTTATAGKLSTTIAQGKNIQLYLYVEGSPVATFDA